MTNDEALMILKNEMPSCGRKLPFAEGEKTEAYEIAFKAIEKQIPKKPRPYMAFDRIERNGCPKCTRNEILYAGQKYCNVCGQRIDWEEGELKC